jgi:hypothetical protein
MRTPFPLMTATLLVLSACSRTPPEPGDIKAQPAAPAPSARAAASAEQAASPAPAHEIGWVDPAGWQKVPTSSPMRKATYRVPAASKDGEDAEMAVFYFKGEGGSTEANIQRWIGQFPDSKPSDVKRTQRSAGGTTQTIVEVEGTYASGMPGGAATPKSGYRLIGAVVETPVGPYFFKLTGPKKTVDAARDSFFGMLDSVKPG